MYAAARGLRSEVSRAWEVEIQRSLARNFVGVGVTANAKKTNQSLQSSRGKAISTLRNGQRKRWNERNAVWTLHTALEILGFTAYASTSVRSRAHQLMIFACNLYIEILNLS